MEKPRETLQLTESVDLEDCPTIKDILDGFEIIRTRLASKGIKINEDKVYIKYNSYHLGSDYSLTTYDIYIKNHNYAEELKQYSEYLDKKKKEKEDRKRKIAFDKEVTELRKQQKEINRIERLGKQIKELSPEDKIKIMRKVLE